MTKKPVGRLPTMDDALNDAVSRLAEVQDKVQVSVQANVGDTESSAVEQTEVVDTQPVEAVDT